jgi:hypothetical protein
MPAMPAKPSLFISFVTGAMLMVSTAVLGADQYTKKSDYGIAIGSKLNGHSTYYGQGGKSLKQLTRYIYKCHACLACLTFLNNEKTALLQC